MIATLIESGNKFDLCKRISKGQFKNRGAHGRGKEKKESFSNSHVSFNNVLKENQPNKKDCRRYCDDVKSKAIQAANFLDSLQD